MNNKILVTLTPSDAFITLQTYDARHGKSQNFYIRKETLRDALASHSSAVEADLSNFCYISPYPLAFRYCGKVYNSNEPE